jgi:hypothetical protein
MWRGLESASIGPDAEPTMLAIDCVDAIPGVGLAGDRYAMKRGTFFKPPPDFEPDPDRDRTDSF